MGKREEAREASRQYLALDGFGKHARVKQSDWALLTDTKDWEKGAVEFRTCLRKRKFSDEVELISVDLAAESSDYSSRIRGFYYRMAESPTGKSCYQKLLYSDELTDRIGCDGIYILWNPSKAQWEIKPKPEGKGACIAFCSDDCEQFAEVTGPW